MSGQRWDAMSVTEYQQQGQAKSKWTKIGAAFTNQDGSIGVQLDCLPLDGRIVLQIPLTREQKEARYAQRNNQQGGGRQQTFGGGGYQQGGGQRGGGGRGFGGGGARGGQQGYQQGPATYEPEHPEQGYPGNWDREEGSGPPHDGGGDDVPFR